MSATKSTLEEIGSQYFDSRIKCLTIVKRVTKNADLWREKRDIASSNKHTCPQQKLGYTTNKYLDKGESETVSTQRINAIGIAMFTTYDAVNIPNHPHRCTSTQEQAHSYWQTLVECGRRIDTVQHDRTW